MEKYYTEMDFEYTDGLPIAAINLNVFFRANSTTLYATLKIEDILRALKQYSVIIFHNSFATPEKLIGSGTESKKLSTLYARGFRFKALFIDKLFASPYPEFFTNCKLIVGYAGHADIMYDSDTITHIDAHSDLNLANNLGVEFRLITDIGKDVFIINNTPFHPAEYFHYKREKYVKYEPFIEPFRCDRNEVIYVAGPPSMGKTTFARYIRTVWGYHYATQLTAQRPLVVDANPTVASDFKGAHRIFSIYDDGATSESLQCISRHMLLAMKRFYHENGQTVNYNTAETDKYFETKESQRYPKNIEVIYFDYIPYQLFSREKYINMQKYLKYYLY